MFGGVCNMYVCERGCAVRCLWSRDRCVLPVYVLCSMSTLTWGGGRVRGVRVTRCFVSGRGMTEPSWKTNPAAVAAAAATAAAAAAGAVGGDGGVTGGTQGDGEQAEGAAKRRKTRWDS